MGKFVSKLTNDAKHNLLRIIEIGVALIFVDNIFRS
ncbi:MAG: hypothetical protein ACI81Y_002625, partial [Glaciecola sp.]